MPIRLQSSSDFWARIFGDSATTGDGTSSSSPARYDGFNSDIGAQADSAASNNTGTFSLIALIKRLLNVNLAGLPTALGQTTMSASLPVVIASNQSGITTVSRAPVLSTTTVTRPGDITAYTGATSSLAGDSISSSTTAPADIVFTSVVLANGGAARIERAMCRTSQTAMAGAIRLHLFRTSATPTKTNDNSALTLTYQGGGNALTDYIGFIDFSGWSPGSSGAYAEGLLSTMAMLPFTTNASSTSLFALLECRVAFTPASAQTFEFVLSFDQI